MASSHRIINWLEEHPELREHVKNQEDRANCWAIVVARAIGARHTIHKRVKALRWLLSAQYLMENFWHDRSSDIQNGSNGREARDPYGNYPLNAQFALEYVTQKGMPYEEDYPYTGSFDRSEPIKDTSKLNKVYISSFSFLGCTSDGEATKEAIYQALLNGGPLIGTVEPTRLFFNLKGGILRPEDDSVSSYNPSNGDSTSEGEADEAEEEADEAEEEADEADEEGDEADEEGDKADEEGDEAEEEGDEAEEEGDKADEEGDEAGSPKSQSHNIDNVGTGADILESESHNSDDPGIISHLILVVGMDFERNTFLVQNSLGRKWGIDGVGTMDCELVYDILDIDINDDRNRGFVGPTSSSSHKQQRELKRLGRRTISGQCLPQKTPERDFRIRISGLEIYNENVKDLLNSDSGHNAKLLDDPEKGTVVEKLVEETANDDQHLKSLIRIFEAQRQVGETAPNDTSSRSHQIIRLTIESTLRENSNCVRSYVARLNFVDLAGSERASQTNPDGVRLREGCHINLSLMTLTTVIRKLSVGKRSGHIPYRDSKLTLTLQHSLGDNARTAIICTLSPVSGHVEQSRNTLFFATRAKEVTNNAQVNMVISDKQLIKHLQKEVARLEAARTPDPLSEKDYKIQQMEKEIEELRIQRDLAQSQVDELRRKLQEPQVLELEANEAAGYDWENENMPEIQESPISWTVTFREQRQEIIEVWNVCFVSIIHRNQFYLLFKGDPSDQIYLEVELKRLNWLQQHLAKIGNTTPAHTGDEPTITVSSRFS
uniref:Kinesin-like protein n=1 Tax=Daucus carota subsp. sativus TaxID=79200 RepID=A0A166J7G7_DAUCS